MTQIKAQLHKVLTDARARGNTSLIQALDSVMFADIGYEKEFMNEVVRCNLIHSYKPYRLKPYRYKDMTIDSALLYLERFQ